MVAKLSSVSTMPAASLATSVPVMPMATPMSACFRAGASLTPSPVMATRLPRSCQARTMRILCSGDTRAYTLTLGTNSRSSSSLMDSMTAPSTASVPGVRMPISLAMAEAVTLWSPVIMMGRMPAAMHSLTAALDSSRGGSIMAMRPRNWRSFSSSRPMAGAVSIRLPKASTRRPCWDSSAFTRSISAFSSGERRVRPSITSTAPLVSMVRPSDSWWTVLISLRSESKGSSASRGYLPRTSASSKP